MARLHSRIYLHFLGVLVVVGLATSLVFALGTRGAFQRDVVERMVRHVASLAAERFEDPAALGQRLQQIRADLAVDVDGARPGRPGGRRRRAPSCRRSPGRGVQARLAGHRGPSAAPVDRGHPVRDPASRHGARHDPGPPPIGVSAWTAFLQPALIVTLVLVLVAAGDAAARAAHRRARSSASPRPHAASARATSRRGRPRRPWGAGGAAGRRAAEELTQLTGAFNEMASRVERMVQSQRELLANVSHELRSPLARIRVALELLPRPPEAEARIRDLERDLAELERLIEDVLTAARLEATGLPAHLAPVDVPALLDDLVERARLDPVTAGCPARWRRERRCASSPTRRSCAAPSGTWWRTPRSTGRRPSRCPRFATATGSRSRWTTRARASLPRSASACSIRSIAARSARAARAAGGAGGVGLGLTLARRVAEAHGGAIVIGPARRDDTGEHGCRVTVHLPAGEAPPSLDTLRPISDNWGAGATIEGLIASAAARAAPPISGRSASCSRNSASSRSRAT